MDYHSKYHTYILKNENKFELYFIWQKSYCKVYVKTTA